MSRKDKIELHVRSDVSLYTYEGLQADITKRIIMSVQVAQVPKQPHHEPHSVRHQ